MKIQLKEYAKRSNGFTLVEILAAITLLGIVIVVFIPFFTQHAVLTSKSEENLDAINLAEQIIYKTKNNEQLNTAINNNPNLFSEDCESPTILQNENYPDIVPTAGYVESNKNYYPKISVCKENSSPNLYVVNVSMYVKQKNNASQFVTEVYGYLEPEEVGGN